MAIWPHTLNTSFVHSPYLMHHLCRTSEPYSSKQFVADMLMQNKFESSHMYLPRCAPAGDMIDTSFSFTTTMLSPPAAYTLLPLSFYASKWDSLLAICSFLLCTSVFASKVDCKIYKHDTLDCNWPAKGGYMCSVLMPATSVYAYAVAFGWIAGYLVLNVCLLCYSLSWILTTR